MKLAVFDIEGTLFRTDVRLPGTSIESTIWQAIAHELGPDAIAEEVQTHERWERREYSSYLDWMKDTISIHQRRGLTEELFRNIVSSVEYNPGVEETLATVDRSYFEIVLVSGGFRELAARAQRDFGIHHVFAACEYLFAKDGSLLAYNLLPCDFEGKIDFIRLMLQEYSLGADDWLFVGDGANDAAIASAAPLSVAYQAHPALRDVATYAIEDFGDLIPILNSARTD